MPFLHYSCNNIIQALNLVIEDVLNYTSELWYFYKLIAPSLRLKLMTYGYLRYTRRPNYIVQGTFKWLKKKNNGFK